MSIYDYTAKTIDGADKTLDDYKNKVMLIVNTASECGFTPQYQGLEDLYRKFKDKGLVVLGFPCNQFGHQEPGDESEIKNFCSINYGISFPLFAKIDVNGDNAHPLYRHLKSAAPGIAGTESIKWNFTKFLVDKSGKVLKRYASADDPQAIGKDIEKLL